MLHLLDLTGMESAFLLTAHKGMWFVFAAKRAAVTHQCFGYCTASKLSQFPTLPSSKQAGAGKKLGGTELGELTPAVNGIPHITECHTSIKSFHLLHQNTLYFLPKENSSTGPQKLHTARIVATQ